MAARRFSFTLRTVSRRRIREPRVPEGMNHVRETLEMARARQRYEEQARQEFDERVDRESGTFGWETFSLFVLTVGALACALLGTLSGVSGSLSYPLAGVGGLCFALILLRWGWARRRRGRRPVLRD
ncbi:hypothetical protein ACIQU3_16430 [Streptomyces sp. NPDC101110]|uniref:hypothetical protein n=1 Tax=unclassified Streptomyces TaxID=2593676 RepID=UPI00380729F8